MTPIEVGLAILAAMVLAVLVVPSEEILQRNYRRYNQLGEFGDPNKYAFLRDIMKD